MDHCQPCQSMDAERCPPVFDRVHVSYLIRGGTRVMWDLIPEFADPLPHTFQLQVGRTGNPNGEWEDVGLAMENSFYAIDGEQRVFGKIQWTHYRVKLETSLGTYYSMPTGLTGILGPRDWRIAREIVRKERLRARLATQEGYLLKRRISGAKCTLCTELQTDEVKDPDCPECYGTGFQCGYYYPMACVWADISPKAYHSKQDVELRGPVSDVVVRAMMLMLPLLEEQDVWINKKTDERYFVHAIQHTAELRGVPLLASVELRPAAFSDVVYSVPIPEGLADEAWE